REILSSAPQPPCGERCARDLGSRLDVIERLLARGAGAPHAPGCRRYLQSMVRTATALERRVRHLANLEVLMPPERAARLAAEVARLRARTRPLARNFCRAPRLRGSSSPRRCPTPGVARAGDAAHPYDPRRVSRAPAHASGRASEPVISR